MSSDPDIVEKIDELEYEESDQYKECSRCGNIDKMVLFKDGKKIIPSHICYGCFLIGVNFTFGD